MNTPVNNPSAPRRFVAKGHDAQLLDAQNNRFPTAITLTSGLEVFGNIARRDKFTITLHLSRGADKGKDLLIYKHAIESILIDKE